MSQRHCLSKEAELDAQNRKKNNVMIFARVFERHCMYKGYGGIVGSTVYTRRMHITEQQERKNRYNSTRQFRRAGKAEVVQCDPPWELAPTWVAGRRCPYLSVH